MSPSIQRNLLLVAIAVALLWTFPYLAPLNNPNENVRLYMAMSLVDDGSFAIAERALRKNGKTRDHGSAYDRFGYVNDKAIVCDDPAAKPPSCAGKLYAAKAPGTSYFGVPVYAAIQALRAHDAPPPDKPFLLFWLRLFVVILPTIVFLGFFSRHLERHIATPFVRHATLLALGAGSLLFSYATTFAGHTLSAVFLGGAWLALAAIDRSRFPLGAAFLAGLLAAAAVLTEYPSALGAALLFGWLLLRGDALPRGRWRLGAAFVAGALPPGFLLMLFHHVCFGAPWRTPYSFLENTQFVADIAPGVMGLHAPSLEAFVGSFFTPYNGLFVFAPWTLLLIPTLGLGLWRLVRRPAATGRSNAVGLHLLVVLVYGLFISSHSLWRGGWTLGPRYIVMAVPFMALAVAHALDHWARRLPRLVGALYGGLLVASVLIVVGIAQVSQGFPFEFHSPIFEFAWPMLRDGYVYPNLGNLLGLHGLMTLVPVLVLLAAALAVALRASLGRVRASALLAVAIAFVVLAGMADLSARPWSERKAGGLSWQRRVWPQKDQAPDQRRLAALEEMRRQRPLTDEEQNDFVRLRAMRGKLDEAWRSMVPRP